MGLLMEIELANRRFIQAQQNFEWAEKEYVESASHELISAKEQLSNLLAEAKREGVSV